MRISDWSSDVCSSDLYNLNQTLQDLALTVEANYYTVIGGRALVDANQQALDEAPANLDAAQTRHTAGLATIADANGRPPSWARVCHYRYNSVGAAIIKKKNRLHAQLYVTPTTL